MKDTQDNETYININIKTVHADLYSMFQILWISDEAQRFVR